MKQLTSAIANLIDRSIEAAMATPGSLERDRARTEARVAKQVLDEEIGRFRDAYGTLPHPGNSKYRFRAVGPGLDFAEWCDKPEELDDILERLKLAIEKFKRDAAKAAPASEDSGGK